MKTKEALAIIQKLYNRSLAYERLRDVLSVVSEKENSIEELNVVVNQRKKDILSLEKSAKTLKSGVDEVAKKFKFLKEDYQNESLKLERQHQDRLIEIAAEYQDKKNMLIEEHNGLEVKLEAKLHMLSKQVTDAEAKKQEVETALKALKDSF